MASNILSIGSSALAAAQVGLSTTGHNIANASTPGYSRQVAVQTAATAQQFGYGYIGQGTQVAGITRVFNELMARQVINSQSVSSSSNIYNSQLGTINNMLSDATAGLNPSITEFFGSVQDVAANPSDTPSRQSMLSFAQSLASRFQSTNNQLNEMRGDVNSQLTASVGLVNTYAKQIAGLNDSIEKAVSATGDTPNDLMDQRDQLVNELSKQIKTTVVSQNQGSYNIYIGNGLPLVVGVETYGLTTTNSPTDTSRLELAYKSNDVVTIVGINSLPGGNIGGLLQFRAESLDTTQNKIGQIALVLAETFNTQLKQGVDLNGDFGTDLFSIAQPVVSSSIYNTGNASISAAVVDARAITSSNYRLQYDGSNYNITRLSDNQVTSSSSLPLTLDGLNFSVSGTMVSGNNYVIRPTQNAAASFNVVISDVNKLAIAGAELTATTSSGSASISALTAQASSSSPTADPMVMTYNGGSNSYSVLPSREIVVTDSGGNSTTYAAGTAATIPSGATVAVAGLSFSFTGTPTSGDTFTVTRSSNDAPGDNSNGLLLSSLQTENTLNNSQSTYINAFAELVNTVGNKSRELTVNANAEAKVLQIATTAMQSESGVNLDEEATNLIRYQQAYQAAGKMMQIASQLFDTLLQIR
jgi:flagellar hook-associated protein 1 FlgK